MRSALPWRFARAHVAAFTLAFVFGAAPWASAQIPGDYNFNGFVEPGDLGVWDFAKFTSDAADGNLDGVSDVEDLMIWDDHRGQIAAAVPEAPAVLGIPDVRYNPATGAVSLVPNSTAIYAFKVAISSAPPTPVSSELPGAGAWSVVSQFGALQGYDTTIVTNSPTFLPQFPLTSVAGPVTIGQALTGLSAGAFGPFRYDTTTALQATVAVQVIPEPASAAMLLGGAAMLCGLSRRRRSTAAACGD